MKSQIMQMGVGIAALSALAAEGKDFSREELNAMLDKLAATPEPNNVISLMSATCYVRVMPRPEKFEYVCKKCGAHTVYLKNTLRIGNAVARYRDGAASLRSLGFDIELDETVLCGKCHSAKELNIPAQGKFLKDHDDMSFRDGETVAIIEYGPNRCIVMPLVEDHDYWISARYISEKGEVLGNNVNIRSMPLSLGRVVARVDKGIFLGRLPAKEGDPKEWVRVEPLPLWKNREDMVCGTMVATKDIGCFSYDETFGAAPARFHRLAWIINGKRSIVRNDDIEILQAFLKGEKVRRIDFGEEVPLKRDLPRLNVLLGPVVEPPPPGRTPVARKIDGLEIDGIRSKVGAEEIKVEVEVDL